MTDVEFVYEAPDISEDGGAVTWRWSVVNNTGSPVTQVVLTHRMSPPLPITRVSGPSEVLGEAVKSRWETLAADEQAEGEIVATMPDDLDGTVQISGRVTWQRT
ncbi:hypothetical protein F4556_007159 [Kitasatospora gansuensis]|uniref:Uncharacterized protein n=1 Tax=Kitasatospora gansuensis TaxID=258050 RepID=A0A7W7SJH9_9ACTN|nr:hypothetical protein [Kitasatospora gansuensis]MBB4951624.1 hypothetical protein [Kitasatospora gansuensis]